MSTNGKRAANARQRSDYAQVVAAQVRAEEAAAGLKQQDVINRSGVSKSTYRKLREGERVADIDQLERICRAIGVPLTEFFRRVDARMESTHRTVMAVSEGEEPT